MAASPETTAERDTARLDVLVATYRPLPGIFDDMMDDGGRVRPHWRPLLDMLATLGPEEINRRFAAADRYLRSSGVFLSCVRGRGRHRAALAAQPCAADP
jgi:uncharacterized circularly permuted ATP-grasp superfamily protein